MIAATTTKPSTGCKTVARENPVVKPENVKRGGELMEVDMLFLRYSVLKTHLRLETDSSVYIISKFSKKLYPNVYFNSFKEALLTRTHLYIVLSL